MRKIKNKSLYWQNQAAQQMYKYMESAEKISDEVSKIYYKYSQYLNTKVSSIYKPYKTEPLMTELEARRLLKNKTSIEELNTILLNNNEKSELVKYQNKLKQVVKYYEQIDYIMQDIYEQERSLTTGHYVNLATIAYNQSIANIQQMAGVEVDASAMNSNLKDRIVTSKWSGTNYLERIFYHTEELGKNLKNNLLINLLTGKTNQEVNHVVTNIFAQCSSIARRLTRTESCYIANQAQIESYKKLGIESYIYVAILDLQTSEICQELNGQSFKVSEQQSGVNCPPMHPWCRSTTIPDISDELAQLRQKTIDNSQESNIITDIDKKAIHDYMGVKSYIINEKLRDGTALDGSEKEYLKLLDAALNKMPSFHGNLGRSLFFNDEDILNRFLQSFEVGRVRIFKEYLSTTKGETYNPDGQVQIYIQNAKSGKEISLYNIAEQEVLYKRNSEFMVLNMVNMEGTVYILLEEV